MLIDRIPRFTDPYRLDSDAVINRSIRFFEFILPIVTDVSSDGCFLSMFQQANEYYLNKKIMEKACKRAIEITGIEHKPPVPFRFR